MEFNDIIDVLVIALACFLIFISVMTNSWVTHTVLGVEVKSGLYHMCKGGTCVEMDHDKYSPFMISLGLAIAIICLCVALLFVLLSLMKKNIHLLPIITFLTSIFSAILVLTGCIVFAYNEFGQEGSAAKKLEITDKMPGYCLLLAVLGGLMLPLGGSVSAKKK